MTFRAGPVLACAALGLVFLEPVAVYVQDNHYQTHFLLLWVFFAAALWRSLDGGAGGALDLRRRRDRAGAGVLVLAWLLLWAGLATGSSTLQRLALVATFTSCALLALRKWSGARCAAYGLFMLLCFGVPYSAYFEITLQLLRAVRPWLELPAWLGLARYRVEDLTVVFPHYRLAVTPDCSGLNELVTFWGLAMLGALTGAPSWRRALSLLVLATALAYLANVVRVLVFVGLVAAGWTRCIESDGLHALVGFALCAPFLLAMIAIILRTHRAPARAPSAAPAPVRGLALPWLALPHLALWLVFAGEPPADPTPPAWLRDVWEPPAGWALATRATSEAAERATYGTPWLINARFAGAGARSFELFAYETRSRRHLNVHQVTNCLAVSGLRVEYGPSMVIAGRRWWTILAHGATTALHGYFAFRLDGEERDDRLDTQLEVLRRRLFGNLDSIGFTRVLFDGPLPAQAAPDEREVLAWLAGLRAH